MILDKIFKNEKGENINIFDMILGKENSKDYIYTLAEAKAINLIAKTIAKTEIQIYALKNGKVQEAVDDLYWNLNLQPNYNENGTMFLYKLATKLLTDKKALILINKFKDSQLLYVADSFDVSNDILKGKTFSNIHLKDDEGNIMSVRKNYNQNNAIYYSIVNLNLSKAKTSFKANTSKLLGTIAKSFIQANTPKWRLKVPGGQPTMLDIETKKQISYEEYKKKITEGVFSEEEAIVMLAEIFDLINLNKDSNKNLEDYKDMIKQIGDEVASDYNIPLDIYYGNKTEKSTSNNDFITFAVDPYYELLEDGFNIGLVGKEDFIKGEKILFNRFSIFHRDIIESANGIDKLTSDGFSRNEINKFLKLPRIDEDWADVHHITKNYADAKGGAEVNGE